MSRTDSLRAQDVLVAVKLFSLAEARRSWNYLGLSQDLGMSASTAHESIDRCRLSGLLLPSRGISLEALRDVLVVAAPRVFYAERGAVATGMPTGVHAPPLRGRFEVARGSMPLVWPSDDGAGARRGESIAPIYATAPAAARRDEIVYELLALLDVLRAGGSADRRRAAELLGERLCKNDQSAA